MTERELLLRLGSQIGDYFGGGSGSHVERLLSEAASRVDEARALVARAAPPGTTGRAVEVAPGETALQDALDRAEPGTTLLLTPGSWYGDVHDLPVKAGDAPIVVRSKTEPPRGWNALRAAVLPLVGVIQTLPRAHDYAFIGLRGTPGPEMDKGFWSVGNAEELTVADLPDRIAFDRVHLRCDPQKGGLRGIAMNGRRTDVVDSVIEGFWFYGRDSQACGGFHGVGPFTILRSYLEASGENFLLGGGRPLAGANPGGLTFVGNHCAKPLWWRGTPRGVKNLFELKNCYGAHVEGNLFDNSWVDGQAGHGVLMTVRESNITHVRFLRNVIRNVEGAAFQMLGETDGEAGSVSLRAHDCEVAGNLVIGARDAMLINKGWTRLRVHHNTFLGLTGRILGLTAAYHPEWPQVEDEDLLREFLWTRNVHPAGEYGIVGDGMAPGIGSLLPYMAADGLFTENVIGRSAARPDLDFGQGNFLVDDVERGWSIADMGADVAGLAPVLALADHG